MSSSRNPSFFTTSIIDEFKARPRVLDYLTKHNLDLYNLENIDTIVSSTRRGVIFESLLPSTSRLMQNCYVGVDSEYIGNEIRQIKNKIDNNDYTNVDILIVADKKNYERKGFVVIERGECKDKPLIPALKIICSIDNIGGILLYAYIFALKKFNIPEGILELAGNYDNLSGLCAYNRFGFRENYDLKTVTCFDDKVTLPMSIDITKITNFDDFDKALHKETMINLDIDDQTEPLCDKTFIRFPSKQGKEIEKRRTAYHYLYNKLIDGTESRTGAIDHIAYSKTLKTGSQTLLNRLKTSAGSASKRKTRKNRTKSIKRKRTRGGKHKSKPKRRLSARR